MDLRSIFKKDPAGHFPEGGEERNRPEIPEGLLQKCPHCGKGILTEQYKRAGYVCPKCGGYFRMPARERISLFTDAGSFEEWDTGQKGQNPLHLKGYPERIAALQEKLSIDEAILTGKADIQGIPVVLMVMEVQFLTASMGQVVGEKICRGVERAIEEKLPVILVCCSGGARMQEGISSLMQMAKTAAVLKRHSEAGLLTVTILTDPTMGGVTASFAMLGDIILAEAGALIGFAGPRVIEQTIRQKLPKDFQRAEFLLEHGFVDAVVKRDEMKALLGKLLKFHSMQTAEAPQIPPREASGIKPEVLLQRKKEKTPWERVQLSRAKERPVAWDYLSVLFPDLLELHGDRQFGEDPAILGGIASFHGQPVTVIAQMKGKNTKENLYRNFGMPKPEGYRKALRLMKQAEKFHRPVICLVDSPGAFCGMEAEERGQGEAIARNLFEMSALRTPILSIFIGEGGSGGALALAVADQVWILENATYSILSPEGFASILWKDASLAEKAAKAMRLTSYDLYQMGIVEEIFPEPEAYTAETMRPVCHQLEEKLQGFLKEIGQKSEEELINHRYRRFRAY